MAKIMTMTAAATTAQISQSFRYCFDDSSAGGVPFESLFISVLVLDRVEVRLSISARNTGYCRGLMS